MSSIGHKTTRTITGFRSLDLAFPQYSKGGEVRIGFPNNIPVLVFGKKGRGKTTFCVTVSGIIAAEQKKDIAIRSTEGFDGDWVEQQLMAVGFENGKTGDVLLAEGNTDKKGNELEEYNIDKFLSYLEKETTAAGIFDSLAQVQPAPETGAKSIVENQMGRRAQLVTKMYRHINNIKFWRKDGGCAFFGITHEYKAYEMYAESVKPGGDGKQYLSRLHIRIDRERWDDKVPYVLDDGSYIVSGKVYEFNYGIKGKEFWMFMLANYGMHRGMSAVFDAIQYGVAKRKAGRIVMGGWSYALNEMLREAHARNDDFFKPVVDVMQNIHGVQPKNKEEEEE